MKNDSAVDAAVGPVLFSAEQIAARVQVLGAQIGEHYAFSDREVHGGGTADYGAEDAPASGLPLVVSILKGSFVFVSDLLRAIDLPLEVEFLAVSSYGSATKSSGVVRVGTDIDRDISGRDILVVEDIVDTGATLEHLRQYFEGFGPRSIRTCSLLLRDGAGSGDSDVDTMVDYWGFKIASDAFVIGYGLDHDQRYRNLPFIAEFLAF